MRQDGGHWTLRPTLDTKLRTVDTGPASDYRFVRRLRRSPSRRSRGRQRCAKLERDGAIEGQGFASTRWDADRGPSIGGSPCSSSRFDTSGRLRFSDSLQRPFEWTAESRPCSGSSCYARVIWRALSSSSRSSGEVRQAGSAAAFGSKRRNGPTSA